MKIRCAFVVWGLFAAGRASADIIINHPPLNSGGPAADLAFINDSNMQSWQQLADDFQVTQDAEVRQITWWGFYGSSFLEEVEPPPATETMQVRFYGARAGDGLPDDSNILFEQSFLNPSRTATGRRVSVGPLPPEFQYQIDLATPFSLHVGTPYWLEIVQVGDINSLYRWEYGPAERTGHAYVHAFISDWTHTVGNADLAFQLSTVPEPSSFLLLLISIFHIGWSRKR